VANLHIFQQYLDICLASEPLMELRAERFPAPVVVGAVGGSGSRLVVELLEQAGVMMTPQVNRARDSLLWPPLGRLLESAAARHSSRQAIVSQAFSGLESLLDIHRELEGIDGPLGWKVPASFLWLPELDAYFPKLRFIHVIRHGLDMAYSDNQLQFLAWAWYFGINGRQMTEPDGGKVMPGKMLDYWIAANRFAMSNGRELLGERFLLLDYDALCREPQPVITQLLEFVGLDSTGEQVTELAGLVKPPQSIGRFRRQACTDVFSARQLAVLEEFGFNAD
jgi:hypothetical protein